MKRLCQSLVLLAALTAVVCAPRVALAQQAERAHFHHVMINTVNPQKSMQFYRTTFGASPVKFRGATDALFVEKSFLLFNKVEEPAISKLNSGIWHIGWGGVDVKNEYEWWKRHGVEFHTPATSLGMGPDNMYMYIIGPDKELIEINTMGHHRFAHVHQWATDVNESAEWYTKHLGIPSGRFANKPRNNNMQGLTNIWMRQFPIDNVTMIFFGKPDLDPPPPMWQGEEPLKEIQPTKGHVFDRLGFSYPKIEPVYERMKADGVKILEPITDRPQWKMKSFIVEGPNQVSIEIVEAKPLPEGAWD